MKKDIKHIIEVIEAEGAQARAESKAAEMEADPRLSENARLRLGGVKLEKWWSVAAGMALIAAFILYTVYLTIPAVILLILLAGFIVYVFAKLHKDRQRAENAEGEISANRSIDALVRRALALPFSGRDVSCYMNADDISAFSAALTEKLDGLGLRVTDIKADCKVTQTDKLSPRSGSMPVSVILTCADTKVELKWTATFALPSTGDCMPDTKLQIL